jgi:maleamate amidohydrolase
LRSENEDRLEALWTHVPRSTLSDLDREVMARAGYGRRVVLGAHPVLLLIDFQTNYLGANEPILKQLEKYPSGGGAGAWRALAAARIVLGAARQNAVPVVFTRIAYSPDRAATNTFAVKRGQADSFLEGSAGVKIVEDLQPRTDEQVLVKGAASAFFGTQLHDHLTGIGADSLLVTGLSTSGCVRATVVDAAALGYRVAVIVEAVADRIELSHRAALVDMWMKYAELVTVVQAVEYIEGGRWPE